MTIMNKRRMPQGFGNMKQFLNRVSAAPIDHDLKLNSEQLFSLLTLLRITNVSYIVLDNNDVPVHGNLPQCDVDYAVFHQGSEPPHITDRLTDFDYSTSDEPVFANWYLTLTYHS